MLNMVLGTTGVGELILANDSRAFPGLLWIRDTYLIT